MSNIETLVDLIDYIGLTYPDRVAFKIRTKDSYDSITYSSFVNDVRALSAAFTEKGFNNSHIAVLGENSYEWVVSYLAAVYSGNIVVPVDKDLTSEEIETILEMSDTSVVLYSTTYDDSVNPVIEKKSGIEFIKICRKPTQGSFYALLEQGRVLAARSTIKGAQRDPATMCAILFTSGTTGVSKGVMLSHTNMLSDIKACKKFISIGELTLSILPMHHTYEFTLGGLFAMLCGSTIAINNSIKYFAQNLKLFRPTDLLVVPLVAETLYNNIWATIRASGKERAVRALLVLSRGLMRVGIDLRKVFFKKVLDALGGNLNSMFCGGALLDLEVAQGLHDFGVNLNIGYGITECSPLISENCLHIRSKYGSCGKSIACCQVKIENPNENGEGEILIKGDNVMLGYYKNEEATRNAFSSEGWYRSGDIGTFDADGLLYITGRKKNVIVLKNGKNIYPEELEAYVSKIDLVKECVVFAEGALGEEGALKSEIFVDTELAEQQGVVDAHAAIRDAVDRLNDKLPYYKHITAVVFREVEFPKTTTKKIKRY